MAKVPLASISDVELNEIINKNLPLTWEKMSDVNLYELFTVIPNSPEYTAVVADINTKRKIDQIKRMQNKTMFGRYLIKKLQYEKNTGLTDKERIMYFCIEKSQIEIIAEYNLDLRRLGIQFNPLKFKLYESTKAALDAYLSMNIKSKSSPPAIIVIRTLAKRYIETDSQIYPEYFIILKETK